VIYCQSPHHLHFKSQFFCEKELTGYPGYYRVDSEEYRIVYRFDPDVDLVEVILVGTRNDDEVYKQLKR
jgi:mRNA interferase RelE/StbE